LSSARWLLSLAGYWVERAVPMLPEWMKTEDRPAPMSRMDQGRRPRRHRMAAGLMEFARREVIAEASASKPGFLQKIDPRAKLVSALLLVVATSFSSNLAALCGGLVVCTALVLSSRVSFSGFVRSLLPPLVFPIFIILPATLNLVTPGRPLLQLLDLGGARQILGVTLRGKITITAPGAFTAARFALRAVTCVSWVSALALTTRWTAILSAARSLGLPHVFTLTLTMAYRYVFALARYAEEGRLAKESRTIARESAARADRLIAARMGRLFQTARRLGDEVYLAMAARGFSGAARSLNQARFRFLDVAAVVIAAAISAGLALSGRVIGG
jgi:cobalt/nickel transport system permease protein